MRRRLPARPNPFEVKYRNRSIFSIRVPSSKVTYNAEFEHALAAHWWRFRRVEELYELPPEEQAYLIGIYRVKHQLDAVIAWESRPRRQPVGHPNRRRG